MVTQPVTNSAFAEATIPNQEVECVLAATRKELQSLLEQRSTLLKRINTLRRTINSLMATFGNSDGDQRFGRPTRMNKLSVRHKGLTSACRSVLTQSDEPISAAEVTERILRNTPSVLSNNKSALSSVTTILRRLQSYGEANSTLNLSGKRVWAWGPSEYGADHTSLESRV